MKLVTYVAYSLDHCGLRIVVLIRPIKQLGREQIGLIQGRIMV